jgi:hypothetical protein
MATAFQFKTSQEDFLARITEAAYDVVLRQGLQRSFVDVELELWQKVRSVFRNEVLFPGARPARPAIAMDRASPEPRAESAYSSRGCGLVSAGQPASI